MADVKEKIKTVSPPKVSVIAVLKTYWSLIKLIFRASPAAYILFALEALRNSVLVFFEHTWLIKYVLECVEYKRPFKETAAAIVIIFLIIVISMILGSVVSQWLDPKARLRAKTDLRNMLYDKARSVDLEQFDNPEYYNDFIMSVEKVDESVDRAYNFTRSVVYGLGGIMTTGIFFVSESPIALATVLVSTAVRLVCLVKSSQWNYSKYAASKPYSRKTEYVRRLFYFQDFAKEIRLNPDMKQRAFKDYDESYDGLVETTKFYNRKALKLMNICTLFTALLMDGCVLLVLVYQASVLRTISYASVVVMFNSMYRLRQGFLSIAREVADSAETCMYIDKIKAFLKTEVRIKSGIGLPVKVSPCSVCIKDLSFRYNDADGDVLHGISLKINAGEKIALVGYNGAGKTTLIKLIMRLYDPTGGTIETDGKNICDYDVAQYRSNIGVIFQDFNIYAATVKENVVMGPAESDPDKDVELALNRSGFSDRLSGMADGIHTQLTKEFDDEGTNLSGGENQKIAIARSFYRDAGLIILDEPSSALDPIAEYNFNRYLLTAAADRTVIFISHRLSTTRNADRIYMMEHGRIVEAGTHDELLAMNGKYAAMWHAQADKYAL